MIIEINSNKNIYEIDEVLKIEDKLLENTDIKELKDVMIKGILYKLSEEIYELKINVSGTMILLCVLSLEEIDHPFNININETIIKEEENINKLVNTIDIFPIIWENIVLEIPSRIVKDNSNIKTSGDGWSLTSEDEFENQLSTLKNIDMEEER